MDELAKYILGQNPDLYKEKISSQEITKIRAKIEMDQVRAHKKEVQIKAEQEELKRLKKIELDNTLKEKSKRYIADKGKEVKTKFFDRLINSLKSKN